MKIAALYIDAKRGPYAGIAGVDAWGIERDATQYAGPWPVVAHPPCGHWGRYAKKCHDDGLTGPIAVAQVRQFGGVLEHPKDSGLWRECGLPRPGEPPDAWGGYTVLVFQRDWGHRADKATWLYCVRVTLPDLPEPQEPRKASILEKMSKKQRHLTPNLFADWLVLAARSVNQ